MAKFVLDIAGARGVDDEAVLLLEQHLHVLLGESGKVELLGIGGGAFADAAPLNEDLRLEESVMDPGLTLDVIDGVAVLDVSVEAENQRDRGGAGRSSVEFSQSSIAISRNATNPLLLA